MDKKVYYAMGFILIAIVLIFGISFEPKLTGKIISGSSEPSTYSEWPNAGRDLMHRNFLETNSYVDLSSASVGNYDVGVYDGDGFISDENSIYGVSDEGIIHQVNASNLGDYLSAFPFDKIEMFPTVTENYLYARSMNNFYQIDSREVSNIINNVSYPGSDPGQVYPVVYGGYVYVMGDNELVQLDANDITNEIASFPFSAVITPSIYDDKLYVVINDTGSNDLYVLNASNISQNLGNTNEMFSEIFQNPPVIVGGKVYCYVGNEIFVLNADDVNQVIDSTSLTYDIYHGAATANDYVYLNVQNYLARVDLNDLSDVLYMDSGDINLEPGLKNLVATKDYLYYGGNNGTGDYIFKVDRFNLTNIVDALPYSNSLVNLIVLQDRFYYILSNGRFYHFESSGEVFSSFSNLQDNSPINDGEESTFQVEVDSTNGTVYLEIDNSNETATNVYGDVYQVNLTLGVGIYSYSWWAYGALGGGLNQSEEKNYVVNEVNIKEPEEPSTSGSGGGSTGVGTPSQEVNLGELESNNQNLDLTYGSKLGFSTDGQNYDLSLNNIDRVNNQASFEFSSLDELVVLNVDEEKGIDLNKDFIEDINLKLVEIDSEVTKVGIQMKRRVVSDERKTIGEFKFVSPVEEDISEELVSFDPVSSRIFGWIFDIFNSNRMKCGNLGDYVWSSRYDFCVSEGLRITSENRKVLRFLRGEIDFGNSFVQVEEIVKYDCGGCFVVELKVDGIFVEYSIQDWNFVEDICIPLTCSEVGYVCGSFSDGCGRDIYCGECRENYFCSEGTCIPNFVPLSCLDSDGGKNYFEEGKTTDRFGILKDYCVDDVLFESICEGVTATTFKYDCPYGCNSGVCLDKPTSNCADDDGMDFYNQGTIYYIDRNDEQRSRKDSCTNKISSVGWTHDLLGIYNYDFNCPPQLTNIFPYYGGKMYECPEGCISGKCIIPNNQTSYCDDNGYCKLYMKEYLVFEDFVSVNADYIFTNEGLSITGDYNYYYPQKTDLVFSVGNDFEIKSGELNEGNSFDYDFGNQGFFWMNFTILNIFSNRDSKTVYDDIAIPYVEFVYDVPGFVSNTKARKLRTKTTTTKPILKSVVIYDSPTIIDDVGRVLNDMIDRGNVGMVYARAKDKRTVRSGSLKNNLK